MISSHLPHRVLERSTIDLSTFPPELIHLINRAPSRRYFRHSRGCVCCEARAPDVAYDHTWTNVYDELCNRDNATSRIIGWSHECADCALAGLCFQLCDACFATGEHGHPTSHSFIRSPPPRTSDLRNTEPDVRRWYDHTQPSSGAIEWSWSKAIVTGATYEQLVYGPESEDVLVGFVNTDMQTSYNPGGIRMLMAYWVPLLSRLINRLEADLPSTQRCSLRCLLWLEDLMSIDSEFLEVTFNADDQPCTIGALVARHGGCLLCPAGSSATSVKKAFRCPEQRDLIFSDWYGKEIPMTAFNDWVTWVHSSMRGVRFDLHALLRLADQFSGQNKLLVPLMSVADEVEQASKTLELLSNSPCYNYELPIFCIHGDHSFPFGDLFDWFPSHVALEDIDVTLLQSTLDTIQSHPSLLRLRENMAQQQPYLTGMKEDVKLERTKKASKRVCIPASDSPKCLSVSVFDRSDERAGWQDTYYPGCINLLSSQFIPEVLHSKCAALVAFLPTLDVHKAWPILPHIMWMVRVYFPALARLIELYDKRRGTTLSQSLKICVFDLSGQNLDPNWRWVPHTLITDALHPHLGPGALCLYTPSASQSDNHCSVYDSFWPQDMTEWQRNHRFRMPSAFSWPSFSQLIDFVGGHISSHVPEFDLLGLLSLANELGMQQASEAFVRCLRTDRAWQLSHMYFSRLQLATEPAIDDLYPDIDNPLESMDPATMIDRIRPAEQYLAQIEPSIQLLLAEQEARALSQNELTLHFPLLYRPRDPFYFLAASWIDIDKVRPEVWEAQHILQILDRSYIEQMRSTTLDDDAYWSLFDSENSIPLAARLTVFRSANSSGGCASWCMMFQVIRCAGQRLGQSRSGTDCGRPRLSLCMVAPSHVLNQPDGGCRICSSWTDLVQDPPRSASTPHSEMPPTCTTINIAPRPTVINWAEHWKGAAAGLHAYETVKEYEPLPIEQSAEWFTDRGVTLSNFPQILDLEVFDAVIHETKDRFFLTSDQLLEEIAIARAPGPASDHVRGLVPVAELSDWYHRDPRDPFDLPSQNATFRSIAQSLQDGIPIACTDLPRGNTHRENWKGYRNEWRRVVNPFRAY